jgi:hypothetical protein
METMFCAYDLDDGEYEWFDDESDALDWVKGAISDHESEGIGEEAVDGGIGYMKVLKYTKWKVTDRKIDYEKRGEDWPFNDEWDEVGPLELIDAQ